MGLQNHRGAAIIKQESLFQGGVKFPTGGIARDHLLLAGADLVKLQGRRYSPDERNDSKMSCTCALFLPVGVKKGAFVCPPACVYPEKSATGFRKSKAMQRRRRKSLKVKRGCMALPQTLNRANRPGGIDYDGTEQKPQTECDRHAGGRGHRADVPGFQHSHCAQLHQAGRVGAAGPAGGVQPWPRQRRGRLPD